MNDLAVELQKIYDSEINVRISWFWDCGFEVWIGDEMNGYLAQEVVASAAEIVPWFQEAVAHFYPDSTYAKALADDVRVPARIRLFAPPRAGTQVRCPLCDAPHAAPPSMTELIGFTCQHCGAMVKVERPKTQ